MAANGLVAVDVAIAAPTAAQFSSLAEQAQTLNYNPAFASGGAGLSYTNTASPSTNASASQNPLQNLPTTAAVTPGVVPGASSAVPVASSGLSGAPLQLSGTMLIVLLALGAILLLGGQGGGRRR